MDLLVLNFRNGQKHWTDNSTKKIHNMNISQINYNDWKKSDNRVYCVIPFI